MLSLLEVMRFGVFSASGKRVGRVVDVLFRPDGLRVAGFVVQRPRLLMLLDRKDRYLALDRARISGKRVTAEAGRDSWDAAAAKRLGLPWDDSVIWVGMPVRTESGEAAGSVRDGLFDPDTGALGAIGLTGGVTADLAVGVRDIPVLLVRGYEAGAIIVSDEALATETSGGAAAAAGRGVAVAKQAGGEAAKQAADVARKAAAYGASAARVAAKSEAGKKAAGWFKAIKDEVVDAMGDPEE